jgi:hypothetical protein
MARLDLNSPSLPHMGPNTGDSPERGDLFKTIIDNMQAMMMELFARTGGDSSLAASGLAAQQIPLTDAMTEPGVFLTATPGSGAFGISLTAGTSVGLTGESTSASSKTDTALFDFVVPQNYVAGQNLTLTLSAKQAGAGTVTVETLNANAYLVASGGTQGADLIGVSAKNLTTANADYAFTIAGAGLVPGSHLQLKLVTVITTSTGAANSVINSARIS